MKRFYLHVQYSDNEGFKHFRSTSLPANNILEAHADSRKLVELLTCEPDVKSVDAYYVESLKIE